MEVQAKLRFLRASPRKVKLVIDMVRRLPLARALEQLAVLPQAAARPVIKLINSAAANAVNNNKLDKKKLWIKSVVVGQGPRLKRWRPRAMGRATPIHKPTCHIIVVLSDEDRPSRFNKKA
jgi:large subunit ribosomal protein L22